MMFLMCVPPPPPRPMIARSERWNDIEPRLSLTFEWLSFIEIWCIKYLIIETRILKTPFSDSLSLSKRFRHKRKNYSRDKFVERWTHRERSLYAVLFFWKLSHVFLCGGCTTDFVYTIHISWFITPHHR